MSQFNSGSQSAGLNTTYCRYCNVQLSYPSGSMYIQCPKCRSTMNPQAPVHTTCIGCGTLLAHPASTQYIQCPKCMVTMNARDQAQMTGALGGPDQRGYGFGAGKPKKRRDPNAPKAASNAYMIFCKDRRAQLKKDNPDLPFGKIGAKLGEVWRTMSPDEKKPYEEKAAKDRERYRKEMEEYQSGGASASRQSDDDLESRKRDRPLDDMNDPDLTGAFKKVKSDVETEVQ